MLNELGYSYSKLDYARRLATIAHNGQERRYTGEPYIVHPTAVMKLVMDCSVWVDDSLLIGAMLHDTVEDTEVNLVDIRNMFGTDVEQLVYWLTDISRPSDGNRAKRKEQDRLHIANAPTNAKTIKLADLIDNTRSIVKYDPGFAKVYMKEKKLLLEVLIEGDKNLFAVAKQLVENYYRGESLSETN